jgi:GntR family transcriptional regulator, rspAB operon transcriptional repressor
MPRLDNLTLRERVHDHLKQEILADRYRPGSELLEVPLAEELGVSRGPIREALRSLESEGLVQITPRRGAVVVSLTKRDFLEAYQVREALEALGVRLAVPILSTSALDDLDEQLDVMTRHAVAGEVDAFFESNARFHEAFMEASGNRKLIEAYRRLIAQMRPYRRPSALLRGNVERSIAEHRSILVAARRRDVDSAVAQLVKHIEVPQRLLERMTDEEFARAIAGVAAS